MIKGCLWLVILFVAFILFLTVYISESAKQGGGVPQERIERQER